MSIFQRSVTCSFFSHILTRTQGKKFEDMFLVKMASKGTSLTAPSAFSNPTTFSHTCNCSCSQLLLKSVSKLFENVEWSNSLLRHFKILTLLKINCCISAFRVTQHSQIFSLFFRNRIQCIALYQLHNSQALLNLYRGYFTTCENFMSVRL